MTQSHPLTLRLRADGRLIAAGSRAPQVLLADVACAAAEDCLPPPAPIAVMLAVDVSGSMAGGKLDAARAACAQTAAGLGDGDLLGLCAFDDTARILLPLTRMDAAGRARAAAAISGLRHGGSTALCDGWRAAAGGFAAEDPRLEERALQVVILSDGMGNQGETRPEALAEFASSFALRGVCTSAIGVGDDWCAEQLEALALSGGGRLHHALEAEEIAALLLGEIRGLQNLGALGLELALALPTGFTARVLTPETGVVQGGEMRLRLGAVARGGRRTVAVQLAATAAAGTGPWVTEATLHAFDPATRAALPALHAALRFDAAADEAAARAAREPAAALEAAQQWLAFVTRSVMRANREGRVDRAALADEARSFARYCQGLAGAERMSAAMSRLEEQAESQWTERQRKIAQMAAFKQGRSESVHVPRAMFLDALEQTLQTPPEERDA